MYVGAINLTQEEFVSVSVPAVISDVECTGVEIGLNQCSYSPLAACGELDDAGVICQSKGDVLCMCNTYYSLHTFSVGKCCIFTKVV